VAIQAARNSLSASGNAATGSSFIIFLVLVQECSSKKLQTHKTIGIILRGMVLIFKKSGSLKVE
jgi:hypothetical protein